MRNIVMFWLLKSTIPYIRTESILSLIRCVRVFDSVSILKKSGIPLAHIKGNGDIKMDHNYDPDFSIIGGVFVESFLLSEWLGDTLQCVVTQKRTLWIRGTDDLVIIVAVKRNHSPIINMVIDQLAVELTEAFSGIIKHLGMSQSYVVQEPGLCDLVGEIVRRKAAVLNNSTSVQELALGLSQFDYQPSISHFFS